MTIVTVLFELLVAAHIAVVGLMGFAAVRVRWTQRGIAAVLGAGGLVASGACSCAGRGCGPVRGAGIVEA